MAKEVIEGWIARDEDKELCIHHDKPKRGNSGWFSYKERYDIEPTKFPNLKWEDEPQKVLITIETIE